MSNPMPGGWSAWNTVVTPEAEKVFQEVTRRLLGVRYKPLAFASQVVAGLNYCFLCETESVTLDPARGFAKLYVFAPLEGGEPILTKISPIEP